MARKTMGIASLVVARNDVEAVWLAALAARVGMHVVAVDDLKWGDVIPVADPRLSGLADTVLIAELPSPPFERQLRDRGHRVHVLDHHVWTMPDGTLLDRSAPRSTLEQALSLAPVMNGTCRPGVLGQAGVSALVAANDRGFIPGLAAAARALSPGDDAGALGWTRAMRLLDLTMRHGAPPEKVEGGLKALENMDADRGSDAPSVVADCLGEPAEAVEKALNAAIKFLGETKDGLAHVRPRRGPAEAGVRIIDALDRHRPVLMDALYTHIAGDAFDRLTVTHEALVLYAPDRSRPISRVEFSGRSDRRELVDELMAAQAEVLPGGAVQYCGGCNETCFYGAVLPSSVDADALADCLLRNLLVDERPVAGWRTHFMQAFALTDKWDRQSALERLPPYWCPEKPSPSFQHYVTPHLRPILAPTADLERLKKDDVLATFRWSVPGYTLAVERDGSTLEAEVSSLSLHLFHGNAVLIEWSIEEAFEDSLVDESTPLWRRLLRAGENRWTLGDILDFNAYARFTTSTFPGPTTVLLKCGKEVARLTRGRDPSRDWVTGWFKLLLEWVLKDFSVPDRRAEPLYDERARVVASAVLVGSMPDLSAGRAALAPRLARLMVVDPGDAGWHADPNFAARELDEGRYSRFDRYEAGTAYGATSHSFIALMGGEGPFSKLLHNTYMPTVYRRLFILILFYGINLGNYARDLTIVDIDEDPHAYFDLHERYSRFSNNLWFETVSTQIQGTELFQLMRRQSGVAAEFRQIEHEIETSSSIAARRTGKTTERFQRRIAWFGLLIACLTIVIDGPQLIIAVIESWRDGRWTPLLRIGTFAAPLILAGGAAFALWRLLIRRGDRETGNE